MNALNSLIHALRGFGGFATQAQLDSVRPKLKDVMKSSVELVDHGWGVWEEAADGSQQLRLTDKTLEKMAGNCLKMTNDELRTAFERGDDLTGFTILVVKG